MNLTLTKIGKVCASLYLIPVHDMKCAMLHSDEALEPITTEVSLRSLDAATRSGVGVGTDGGGE